MMKMIASIQILKMIASIQTISFSAVIRRKLIPSFEGIVMPKHNKPRSAAAMFFPETILVHQSKEWQFDNSLIFQSTLDYNTLHYIVESDPKWL